MSNHPTTSDPSILGDPQAFKDANSDLKIIDKTGETPQTQLPWHIQRGDNAEVEDAEIDLATREQDEVIEEPSYEERPSESATEILGKGKGPEIPNSPNSNPSTPIQTANPSARSTHGSPLELVPPDLNTRTSDFEKFDGTVAEFSEKFKDLAVRNHLYPDASEEGWLRELFLSDLKSRVRNDMFLQDFDKFSLRDLYIEALKCENSLKSDKASGGAFPAVDSPSSSPSSPIWSLFDLTSKSDTSPVTSSSTNHIVSSSSTSRSWPMEFNYNCKNLLVRGKIPKEEMQYRIDNNLCHYCAGPHGVKKCRLLNEKILRKSRSSV